MQERSFRSTRQKPSVTSVSLSFDAGEALPPCEYPGCTGDGTHRAPRSRWPERHGYYAFCLEHVRVYNENWDYYSGMSPDEIELSRRDDVTWNRPSWGFGHRDGAHRDGPPGWQNAALNAAFARMFGDDWSDRRRSRQETRAELRMANDLRTALMTLEMIPTPPVTFSSIKQAYKRLAKQHHPDISGPDPEAENRFKAINEAYALLKKHADLFPG
jgi:hypothetical protein